MLGHENQKVELAHMENLRKVELTFEKCAVTLTQCRVKLTLLCHFDTIRFQRKKLSFQIWKLGTSLSNLEILKLFDYDGP